MLTFPQTLASSSSRLLEAIGRARALQTDDSEIAGEALAFTLEKAAWAMIESAQAWVFELRLGIPRKESENFDLLQRGGRLDLELARRFKQLCEFRALSQREPGRTDWAYLRSGLISEFALFETWDALSRTWGASPR